MTEACAAGPLELAGPYRRRVRLVVALVPALALAVGASAGFARHAYVLVAAAVVFGWSQLAGA